METLKDYVTKRLDRYTLDKQSLIKLILLYYKADEISINEYCKNILNVEMEKLNSNEIINSMVSMCPLGKFSLGKKDSNDIEPKRKALSFKADFNRDEIYD